jgi:hypothetical protein
LALLLFQLSDTPTKPIHLFFKEFPIGCVWHEFVQHERGENRTAFSVTEGQHQSGSGKMQNCSLRQSRIARQRTAAPYQIPQEASIPACAIPHFPFIKYFDKVEISAIIGNAERRRSYSA